MHSGFWIWLYVVVVVVWGPHRIRGKVHQPLQSRPLHHWVLLPSKCAATAANVDGNQMIRKKCGNICLYCLTVPTYGQIPIKCVRNRSCLLITLIKCQVLPTQNFALHSRYLGPSALHSESLLVLPVIRGSSAAIRKELPLGQ